MAQVGSSPTRLSSVKTVFGGPNNMRAYLRGGAGNFVPGIANAYPNIAASGTLVLSGFASTYNPPAYFSGTCTDTDYSFGGTATSQVLVNTSGVVTCDSGGFTWKFAGNSPDYDVYFLKTAGNQTPSSINVWLSLATSRSVTVTIGAGAGTVTCSGIAYLRMNASPQTGFGAFNFSVSAERENDQCPTCCFTPETMVKLSSGDWIQIVNIQKGDKVATRTGEKEVTEVITRTNRVMYQITFMDGRILNASEDHPLYVVDKGYAAINPGVGGDYKDLGIPDQLYVGDLVLDSDGRENAIVSIEPLDYPDTVYTLAESEFYANGMLVY